MLSLFRNIRKSVIVNSSIRKYLFYALGEVFLVMLGILMALEVNNWNEERKTNAIRKELISDLITELKSYQNPIEERMSRLEGIYNRNRELIDVIGMDDGSTPLDTIRILTRSLFEGGPFVLSLVSYEEARSAGRLSLLDNKEILKAYANIMSAYQSFQLHLEYSAQHYFALSMYEFRKDFGTGRILTRKPEEIPKHLRVSDAEYREILKTPKVFALFEVTSNINGNLYRDFRELNNAVANAIALLEVY